MKASTLRHAIAVAFILPGAAFASCGSAFCTVNTNWTSHSALIEAGSSFDLHYEYIDQDQAFSGGDKVAVGQIPHHHDEVETVNRNLMTTYSHGFGNGWGLSISAALGDRDHAHIHNHHGAALTNEWKFTELGDVRLLARYQYAATGDAMNPGRAGIVIGLKLPTGHFTVENAESERAERSLQPGTGTTDLIVGSYFHQRCTADDASWFVQGQYQRALNSRDGYKAGAQFSTDLGYRKGVGERLGLLAQLNFVHKARDSGVNAEPADSGGRYLFLSPGLSYTFSERLQAYGFFQQPVLRHVNGVQLTADRALMFGVSGRL
ncbi:hypothetical protein [Massilia aerilata]|uniref:Porin n=1 Tax=Massilia aerilata TaxID=453817 RepID=A0ABW0RX98_9BURK